MNQYRPVTPPGIKNDRGRLVLLLIIGALIFGIFTVWPHLENFWDDIMVEISGEFGFPYESRYDKERQEESNMEDPLPEQPTGENSSDPLESDSDIEITTESNSTITPSYDFTTNINSNVSDEMTQQILRESRQQIIDEMTRNGQQDQIPLVLDMLDQMEAQY